MRPTKLTILLLLFAVPIVVYAWLMNSVAAAAAGFAILAFLLLRGCIFYTELRRFTTTLTISRTTDATILTQGGHVKVSADIASEDTPLSITLTDKAPIGSMVIQGSPEYINGRAEYLLRIPVSGKSMFGGVALWATDKFFSSNLTIPYAKKPALKVYAAGIATTFTQDGFSPVDDAQERDRHAIVAGAETRYFRPYVLGDNMADINWKMSAKYDELYVQLRSDASGVHPVLIMDVPEAGTDEKTIATFTDVAVGTIERFSRRDAYPIIAYCGSDCLWIGNSKKEEEIFAYISLAGNVKRETNLFRHKHVAALMKESVSIVPKNEFTEQMKYLLSQIHTRYPTRFEQNIKQITIEATLADSADTNPHDDTSIYVVSTAYGDISHLSYLVNAARIQHRDVVFVLAGIRGTPREKTVLSSLYQAGAAAIEVMS